MLSKNTIHCIWLCILHTFLPPKSCDKRSVCYRRGRQIPSFETLLIRKANEIKDIVKPVFSFYQSSAEPTLEHCRTVKNFRGPREAQYVQV